MTGPDEPSSASARAPWTAPAAVGGLAAVAVWGAWAVDLLGVAAFAFALGDVALVRMSVVQAARAEAAARAARREAEERRRAEAERERVEAELRQTALFEHATRALGVGLALIDERGEVIRTSPTLDRLVSPFGDAATWWRRGRVAAPERAACATCGREVGAGRVLVESAHAGAVRTFEVAFAGHGHGLPSGDAHEILLARDVTETRRAQAELVLADRLAALGTLAAGVAHQINNPLTVVTSSLQLATERLASGRVEGLLALIRESDEAARRVAHTIDELRWFAAAETTTPGPVDIRAVLDTACNLAAFELRHARLERDDGPVPNALAEAGRLVQVFVTLVVYAAQSLPAATADRNVIRLRTTRDDAGRVVVEVADNGPGLAPDVAAHVFDPYFGAGTGDVGAGLGLAVVHGLVHALGGDIAVDTAPGAGCTFRVTLPAATDMAARRRTTADLGDDAPRRRVLVVDDEPLVARSIQRALREHDVEVVTSGRDALERCLADHFDVVVCDVMMPGLSGLDVWQRLRAERPQLADRFVFISGGALSAGSRQMLAGLPNPRIGKPFGVNELRDVVRKVARRSTSG